MTFHLAAPDPEFLYKLALPFADAVPDGTPDHQISPAQLPATGPYMTKSLHVGRSWILIRNPRFRQWSGLAQPGGYPDRIVLRIGVDPEQAVEAVEQGHGDVVLSPPVSRIHELTTHFAGQLRTGPSAGTIAMFLNTRVWPFSKLAARQAVNYAIDRNKMIGLIGGALVGKPTCQILPPTLTGYRPYCPYTINPSPSGAWTRARHGQGGTTSPRLRHSGRQGDGTGGRLGPRQSGPRRRVATSFPFWISSATEPRCG